MMIWKMYCLDMLNGPLLLLREKEVEDEVKKLNRKLKVKECDATMLSDEQ
jgi:hypothetical protein